MPPKPSLPYCEGSTSFDPEDVFGRWASGEVGIPKENNDFYTTISETFNLRQPDKYVYYATAEVTLRQVQQGIEHGGQHGLHAWYRDEEGKPLPPPSSSDIVAYTSIFSSTTFTAKALTALSSNAKKGSLRASIASHLLSLRVLPSTFTIPKLKTAHVNPYYDIWAWACLNLEWSGPDASTVNVKQSHYILPVFYHHFGCLCLSFQALEIMKQLAGKSRTIMDIGSGNGYWTYMLRRHGLTVHAVDNGDSLWRTMWIGDTVKADGAQFLTSAKFAAQGGGGGGKDAILLLVYPQVTTSFTTAVLNAYQGTTIVVAGTQNRNGFTGFKGELVDEWMARKMPQWEKIVQTPLPSFAGKDEALFVFERRK